VCLTGACAIAQAAVLDRRGMAQGDTRLTFDAAPGVYSVSVAVPPGRKLRAAVEQHGRDLVAKTLDAGDPDLYTLVRLAAGKATLRLTGDAVPYRAVVHRQPAGRSVEAEPNDSPAEATPIELGATTVGSGDEDSYLTPAGSEDWFRFEFRGASPKLVFFTLDLVERDNLPVDVSVFRLRDGRPVEFVAGTDPVSPPHEVQALPGNKFTTRVLREPGTYYVRVQARHPVYRLTTAVYPVPPYNDPRQAVQTAVDYIIRAGDSWHANTPRKGGLLNRISNVHQETSLCVACHPTHFSQRAQLYALRNGYQLTGRPQLRFLAERFYNTPRPFYGFEAEGATWTRVISAPANVLGRMAALLQIYEEQVTGEHREKFFRGVREYLKLYYQGRTALPPDETNGNQPLVSAYEVAWYAWQVTPELRPQLETLIAQDRHGNVVDLCYQTLALAAIDSRKHAAHIRRNAERILSLQRPSGQWAMQFDPKQPEAEFQTGHALWALAAAGYPADHPQIAKGLRYLLGRQQEFGGWFDPLQSYENFRTPFRETQMAVLALSSFYPGPGRARTAAGDAAKAMAGVRSPDALVRLEAAEALGNLAHAPAAGVLKGLLGDDNKMVQRTAAWALRQIVSRRGAGAAEVEAALASKDDRTRWGATRVFATHFSYVVDHVRLDPLLRLLHDPRPEIRIQTLKGLWQWWYWDARRPSRDRIEDAVLAAMAEPQHPWVEQNLREAVYNLADENVRYLYNNWIPLLAEEADRDRAVQGRLAVEAALAEKFARVLESGSDRRKKLLLAGLNDFHLRRADAYGAPPPNARPLRYGRIGNDIEQIAFHGKSAERLAQALSPLLDSPDPDLSQAARVAALLVRETPVQAAYGNDRKYGWPDVLRLAGPRGNAWQRVAAALRSAPDLYREFSPPPPKPSAPPKQVVAAASGEPDFAYFRSRIQPLFEARGPDGNACAHCHDTHTLLRLHREARTEDQIRDNYRSALKVVNRAAPEDSLLLRKPTSDASVEGTLGGLSHGGGVRWPVGSPEYQTILEWIRK
jgi:hypothetical protein